MKLARETEVDGFFWDEPHYAYPKAYASITGGAGDDWACRCPECMKKFEDYYGYEMPKFMNDDVKQFRWREALKTLEIVSKALKEYNPVLEITCCVHATLNSYYVTEMRGYDNWDMVAACPYFDVFSTTIINWTLPETFFREITERTVAMAKKYGKESERWLMGYNNRPEDFSQVDRGRYTSSTVLSLSVFHFTLQPPSFFPAHSSLPASSGRPQDQPPWRHWD